MHGNFRDIEIRFFQIKLAEFCIEMIQLKTEVVFGHRVIEIHLNAVEIDAAIPGILDPGWNQPMWTVPAGAGGLTNNMYMGQEGPLTANWEATWSSDFKTLNIHAAFPGQHGFCGGYFSPLMLHW